MKSGIIRKQSLKKDLKSFFAYSFIFCVVAIIAFWYFIYYRKSMVWDGDGLYQHYNAFVYLGEWCRGILNNLIHNHQLVIPMWEWGLGLGSDIITTLNYYTFGDPFALLSVIIPLKYSEWGYALSIILRFYAAGLSFILYSREMGSKRWSSVCAALVYSFCAFSIYSGVTHPYFINPMIYFPLVLLGCEKVLKNKNPAVLILSLFITVLSNFYFFYKITIFTAIYVLVRLITNKDTLKFKVFLGNLVKIGVYAFVGVMMACVVFLPVVMAFLSNERLSGVYEFSQLYLRTEYEKFLGSFVGTNHYTNYGLMGTVPIAYLAVGLNFIQRKKEDRWSRLFLLLQIIFMLFPIFGFVFNGFGYVSNRWIFVWVFTVAFLFSKKLPELFQLNKKEKLYLGICCSVYAFLCILIRGTRTQDVLVGCLILLLSLVFVFSASYFNDIKFRKITISGTIIKKSVVFLLVFISINQFAFFRYSHLTKDYLSEFMNMSTVKEKLVDEQADALEAIDDDGFYRVENSVPAAKRMNFAVIEGQSTSMMYWSLINPDVINFVQLNSLHDKQSHSNRGFQSRSFILPLISAKYFWVQENDNKTSSLVPYGYQLVEQNSVGKKNNYIYETSNVLPFGYTYDCYLTEKEYNDLTIPERQQATLQAAVVDEDYLTQLSKKELIYSDYDIDFEFESNENVEVTENSFIVKTNGAKVEMYFDAPSDAELYFSVKGLQLEEKNVYSFKDDEYVENLSEYDEVVLNDKLKSWTPKTSSNIYASCHGAAVYCRHYTDENKYTIGREDYLFNFGYSENTRKKVVFKFERAGVYSFDEVSLVVQPVNMISEYVSDLSEDNMTDVKMTTNKISGNISLDEPKLLCFSLPYSEGWKCYVNGEEVETLKTNIMLTGVMLDKGEHDIELVYKTPYIDAGILISGVGVVMALAICLFHHLFYKKKRY